MNSFFEDYDIFSLDDLSFLIQGELNLSSLQSPLPSNNRTLQSFVEAYLGKYTRHFSLNTFVLIYFSKATAFSFFKMRAIFLRHNRSYNRLITAPSRALWRVMSIAILVGIL